MSMCKQVAIVKCLFYKSPHVKHVHTNTLPKSFMPCTCKYTTTSGVTYGKTQRRLSNCGSLMFPVYHTVICVGIGHCHR